MEIEGVGFQIIKNMGTYPFPGTFPFFGDDVVKISDEIHILFIDTSNQDAFAHWVFESAIYLPYFHKMDNLLGGNLYLHLIDNKKSYKKLFTNLFNIPENKFINTLPMPNTSYIPKYTHILQNADISDIFRENFIKLITNFKKNIVNMLPITTKKHKLLYLPRQTIENYAPNDFRVANHENIQNIVLSCEKSLIFDTSTTKNIIDQFTLVRESECILLNCSSPLFVNGFFATNSDILIMECFSNKGHLKLPYFAEIYNIICAENNTHFIKSSCWGRSITVDEDECIELLNKIYKKEIINIEKNHTKIFVTIKHK